MIAKILCGYRDSLMHAMRVINDNGLGIAFVVNDHGVLCGTVTDGDIRRGLLNDVDLDQSIERVMTRQCVYGLVDDDYEALVGKVSNKIKIIPVIDKAGKVVSYFQYNQSLNFPVAIPNLNGNEFKYLFDAFFSTWISSSGKYINKFEEGFANYADCSHGVAVSNGTVALHLALLALGVGAGDEVIVPDLTFAATINAVLHAGATPVIVDVELASWCIDPVEIDAAITDKTKAVIPVHLYGQPCDMDAILDISRNRGISIVEDCAEAHGATYSGRKVGSFGSIGCFSFFGNKVITTGEGGMCVTNDAELDERMRVLRDHGMSKSKRYWHDVVGYNYRMTNLQAAIGLAQLERISEIHRNRECYEQMYKDALKHIKQIEFQKDDFQKRRKITWLVSLLMQGQNEREGFISGLKQLGIDARPFFYPLSDMPIFKNYCKRPTKNAKLLSSRGLNLPTYESLKSVDELKKLFSCWQIQ
ncbi:MAG: aminotransferase class I/II-fold pyridoxal phosphate-dependent enzyme [Methylomonas sp.]|nr:aminotransferase class I/II-fold pyridoxal phosphate-dependent enzyme [Methylomonas sp.]